MSATLMSLRRWTALSHDLSCSFARNTLPRRSLATSHDFVKIVEVGPRDGLQNEKKFVETGVKVELIDRLSATGLTSIEATSFVSPKWIPQFSDNKEVMSKIKMADNVAYPVLVPNIKGYEDAMQFGVKEVAIFASASEGFSMKNINCTVDESLKRFDNVCEAAIKDGVNVRGYLSCVIACPYDGKTSPKDVAKVTEKLLKMGCYEISLADTIGVGTPDQFEEMLRDVLVAVEAEKLALHCHDTNGRATDNIARALEFDIRTIDSSVGGLGGCPYAKNATGNVSTENVLSLLHKTGIQTGVDEGMIQDIGIWIRTYLGKEM